MYLTFNMIFTLIHLEDPVTLVNKLYIHTTELCNVDILSKNWVKRLLLASCITFTSLLSVPK